jgi:hypothetical protein
VIYTRALVHFIDHKALILRCLLAEYVSTVSASLIAGIGGY